VVAGILFVVIQMIHPPQTLSSVTTGAWATVHYLTIAMCLLGLLGIAGIYARQVEAAGWLGLAGVLLFGLWLAALAFSLLPHELERTAAVPVGVGLAWLGYALWSERREQAPEPATRQGRPQLRQAGAE
jgi:hypothetical protein